MNEKFLFFLENAKKVHKEKYEYDEGTFFGLSKPIKIYCKQHKLNFEQRANAHLSGQKCSLCSNEEKSKRMKRIFKKNEIEEIFKIEILCPREEMSLDETISFYCKECFMHQKSNLISWRDHGKKCSGCTQIKKSDFEEFARSVNFVHGSDFDLSGYVFIGMSQKYGSVARCRNCLYHWNVRPKKLITSTCPLCNKRKKISSAEKAWMRFCGVEEKNMKCYVEKKLVDAFQDGCVYFFDDPYWNGYIRTSPFKINKQKDKMMFELRQKTYERNKFFTDLGYKVKCIWSKDWKDMYDIGDTIKKNNKLISKKECYDKLGICFSGYSEEKKLGIDLIKSENSYLNATRKIVVCNLLNISYHYFTPKEIQLVGKKELHKKIAKLLE
jgi:hypothetical protein